MPWKSLQPEGVSLASRRLGETRMVTCFFVFTSVIRSSNQWSEHRSQIFGRQGPFCPPWLPKAVCKLLKYNVQSCLLWEQGRGMGRCYCNKNWNWPKLTIVYHTSILLELQAFNRPQSSKIFTSDRFWDCNYYLSGSRFLMLPTPLSSQNLLQFIFTV